MQGIGQRMPSLRGPPRLRRSQWCKAESVDVTVSDHIRGVPELDLPSHSQTEA